MKIKFLNHSSLLVSKAKSSVLCDPWFCGKAFDGWRLLYENSHLINNIDCDYIWISHEHPDHFSVPTIKELTSKKHFIYQETRDQKVKKWLTNQGHHVREIADQQVISLDGMCLKSYNSTGYDTACVLHSNKGQVFLNANDCRLELGDTLNCIKRDFHHIDAIAIQFSYANWAGNLNDHLICKDQQRMTYERILLTAKQLKCKNIILFASFIYYSHVENFFWNSQKPYLSDICEFLSESGLNPIVPIPDQEFLLEEGCLVYPSKYSLSDNISWWDSKSAACKPLDYPNQNITFAKIQSSYENYYERLWKKNKIDNIRNNSNCDFSLTIKLDDCKQLVSFYLFKKQILFHSSATTDSCNKLEPVMTISKEILNMLFLSPSARGTLAINGRAQFNYELIHNFFIYFFFSYANNIGLTWSHDRLEKHQLMSILNTSILTSIYSLHSELRLKCQRDIDLFLNHF